MKYKNLKEVLEAQTSEAITSPLEIDNDCAYVYEGDEKVYEGGLPEELLMEALSLLGINAKLV